MSDGQNESRAFDKAYDVIVVGGGHAGCEAAAAAARMGLRTLLLSLNLDQLGWMPCNPCIGGTAKGILTREIDALGGLQGLLADHSGLQFRMLNRSRGPAVQSPRAQTDKRRYSALMKRTLETLDNLYLRQELVEEILTEECRGDKSGEALSRLRATGVRCAGGREYAGRTVILTTGTFLCGLLHVGEAQTPGGRAGESASHGLSDSLRKLGFCLLRLKTGTPPRINARGVNFSRMEEQRGDEPPPAFSFRTKNIVRPSLSCWLTRTTTRTHDLIRANLERAPLFSGQIVGTGPRYCPSVELKVVRFPERPSHQVILEPEGEENTELYVNGLSTSLPAEVQAELVRSLPGCEEAEIQRFGYAVEYDFVPPEQIRSTMETRLVAGLFLAGQINGTSGYEEAAGQGLVAGLNAGLSLRGEAPFIPGRDEAYLGVMVDDLATKEIVEPYRLFTSRAEYRLLLRQDNADRRLLPHARRFGLLDDEALAATMEKAATTEKTVAWLKEHRPPKEGATYWELLRRPETSCEDLVRRGAAELVALPAEIRGTLKLEAKYEGYLARQTREVERMRELEERHLPENLDYARVAGLSKEALEKLSRRRPRTLGQAARLDGVTPADLALVTVHLTHRR